MYRILKDLVSNQYGTKFDSHVKNFTNIKDEFTYKVVANIAFGISHFPMASSVVLAIFRQDELL